MEIMMGPALFHELCHAKLNELGYKQVENRARELAAED